MVVTHEALDNSPESDVVKRADQEGNHTRGDCLWMSLVEAFLVDDEYGSAKGSIATSLWWYIGPETGDETRRLNCWQSNHHRIGSDGDDDGLNTHRK